MLAHGGKRVFQRVEQIRGATLEEFERVHDGFVFDFGLQSQVGCIC
jgi:hypothetical protein